MRISRKKRPEKPLIPHYNVNQHITAPEVRVIDREGTNLGVMSTTKAIALAQEQEMDLVEINPKANPPVAELIGFIQFKYQKEKELRKQKLNSKVSDLKGIRLSVRISEHDMGIRVDQSKGFLERGDKVKAEIILKGRDMRSAPLGNEVMTKFFKTLNEQIPVRYEQPIQRQGNKITSVIIRQS